MSTESMSTATAASHKVAIVTGSSSGLGLHTCLQLAEKGFKVFATMRNLDKQIALQTAATEQGVSLEVMQLDVQDSASVQQCISKVMAQEGRIDLLVNNAGAGFLRTTEQATEAEIQWVMDINYMGTVRCCQAVLPHMRAQQSGHIINISSIGGLVGQPFNEFYCAAKFAVEGYTESLASYIQPHFGIHFSLVEPGGIQSEFANTIRRQLSETGGILTDDYQPLLMQYMNKISQRSEEGISQSPQDVAQVVVECACDPAPPLRMRTSSWSNAFCDLKTQADPSGNLNQQKVYDMMLAD